MRLTPSTTIWGNRSDEPLGPFWLYGRVPGGAPRKPNEYTRIGGWRDTCQDTTPVTQRRLRLRLKTAVGSTNGTNLVLTVLGSIQNCDLEGQVVVVGDDSGIV